MIKTLLSVGALTILVGFAATGCSSDPQPPVTPKATASKLVENLAAGKKQTLVVYGTSLTHKGEWTKQVQEQLQKKYPGLLTVFNGAQSGQNSQWGVDNLQQRVLVHNPDTVLIEFAVNDAVTRFNLSVDAARTNLQTMIDRVLAQNPAAEIVLLTMTAPSGASLEKRPNTADYYEMYREVARARKLRLVDIYPLWKNMLENDRTRYDKLVPDGVHVTAQGCAEIITPTVLVALTGAATS